MANRRMFSLDVVNTDLFLDMPVSAQCLYFHLGMRADDDGFIASPKQIMRMATCTQDDMKVLMSKGFIIPFESGIVVIRHWKQHNYIPKDRYHQTIYCDEIAKLSVDSGGVYITDTECIHDVYGIETEVRLGKDKLGKDIDRVRDRDTDKSCKKSNKKSVPEIGIEKRDSINYQQIADMYNDTCVSFPRLTKLSDSRKKAIKARMKQYSIDDFQKLFEMAESSSFLKGKNDRNWSANFDWMLKDANMAKILDGNYEDNKKEGENNGEQDDKNRRPASDYYREFLGLSQSEWDSLLKKPGPDGPFS